MRGTIQASAAVGRRLRAASERCRARPHLYLLLRAGAYFWACLLLAACTPTEAPMPFAASLLAVAEFGFPSACAALGCCVGYLQFWGIDAALEMLAVTVLIFAAVGIFHGTPAVETSAFGSVMGGMMTAVVGVIFLLDGVPTALRFPQYLLHILLAALCPLAYHRALFRSARYPRVFLGGCVLCGAVRLLLPQNATLPMLLFFALAAALFPQARDTAEPTLDAQAVRQRLSCAARALDELHAELALSPQPHVAIDAAQIFDHAADKVCRCCVQYGLCWSEQGQATYRMLCEAAAPILARGKAERGDFPQAFAERCRHLEGFLTAANQEMDALLYRRQYRNRTQEQRQLVIAQYRNVAQYLQDTAQGVGLELCAPCYRPQIGITRSPKQGNARSGDSTACVYGPDGSCCYVLLCDGMGTGDAASAASGEAVHQLAALLRAGMTPDLALKTLNEVYVLRGSGVFSTVDLAELDLCTGRVMLYKWGAAPSYRKRRHVAEKIGTATVPPGVGVGGEDHGAERYRLSLQRGEMLILLSDGADNAETENRIAGYTGSSGKELSAYLVAGAQGRGEDDRTAVVISLQELSSR